MSENAFRKREGTTDTRLSLLFLLVAGPALAQSNAPPASAIPSAPVAPKYTGNCAAFSPLAAAQAGLEGDSVLAIHLTRDGAITNPHLAQSSGHDILDQAAISCVAGAHLAPKTSRGVPLDVDEILQVQWRISSLIRSDAHNNCPPSYPPMAIRLNRQGDTLVSFTVGADGSVKNIVVTRSSGFPALDDAAIECVAQFHYGRVTQGGRPVEYDEQTAISWRLRN